MDLTIKYKPKKWNEIFGNKKTVEELQKRSIIKNHNKNTIFLGITGTGKTSLAKLYGKSIMCDNVNKEGNPCNNCTSCNIIDREYQSQNIFFYDGGSIGVKEVDNIYDLVTSKILGKKQTKLFFIDEMQNIKSTDAQEKLLKILENEYNNTHFIVGAMEWSKLNLALIDRNNIYYLNLEYKDIRECLVKIIENENIEKFDQLADIVVTIVNNSNGSLRRAIRFLERVILSNIKTVVELNKELQLISDTTIDNILNDLINNSLSDKTFSMKLNEQSVQQMIFKLLLLFKKKNKNIRLNRWQLSQIKNINPMLNSSDNNIKNLLYNLFELNKYPYVTSQLIEFTLLNSIK